MTYTKDINRKIFLDKSVLLYTTLCFQYLMINTCSFQPKLCHFLDCQYGCIERVLGIYMYIYSFFILYGKSDKEKNKWNMQQKYNNNCILQNIYTNTVRVNIYCTKKEFRNGHKDVIHLVANYSLNYLSPVSDTVQ